MDLSRRVFVTLLAGAGVLSQTTVESPPDNPADGYGAAYGVEYSGAQTSASSCVEGSGRPGGE